jgi:hypothetical protein
MMVDKKKQGRSNRRAGSRAEHEVVKWLTAAGITAERVPLSGQNGKTMFNSDVHAIIGGGRQKIEVKKRKGGAGFVTINKWMEGSDMLVLRENLKPALVVMSFDLMLELVNATPPQADPLDCIESGSASEAVGPDDGDDGA